MKIALTLAECEDMIEAAAPRIDYVIDVLRNVLDELEDGAKRVATPPLTGETTMPAKSLKHCPDCGAEAQMERVTVFHDGDIARGKWSKSAPDWRCWAWRCCNCGAVLEWGSLKRLLLSMGPQSAR